VRVRLIKKFAEAIDGIDLRNRGVGDVMDLAPSKARLLIAEEWGVAERRAQSREETRQYVSVIRQEDRRTTAIAAERPTPTKRG
jgi:hypothetical protein